ncbi:MAG: cytochrome b/b6 domain-containing protein [Acetobacteraceae bacterium]
MTDPSFPTARIRIWDPWVRVTHWGIAVLLVLSIASGLRGDFDTHFRAGYALLALVLFRLAWGLVGSDTARFAQFLKGPRAALHHLAEFRTRAPETTPGHNPAGGWAVALLLALLLAQAGTGLMANDAIFTFGPLARLVGPDVSDAATSVHIRVWIALLAVVALHVAAVFAYAILRRTDLIGAMITGRKRLPADTAPPRMASPLLAVALMAAASAVVWGISRLG